MTVSKFKEKVQEDLTPSHVDPELMVELQNRGLKHKVGYIKKVRFTVHDARPGKCDLSGEGDLFVVVGFGPTSEAAWKMANGKNGKGES